MIHLPSVTLIAVDCTAKSHLALKAIMLSQRQCSFGASKLLTDNAQLLSLPPTVVDIIKIPKIEGLEGYSKFCIRELTKYVDTEFCLMVQADGFLINGSAWTDEFFKYDWIGAPWNPSGIVGNGGVSLRSKKLLDTCATLQTGDSEHPEDQWISVRHRKALEKLGVRVAPIEIAKKFSFEGRAYNGVEWQGTPNDHGGSLGFHSWLTKLPAHVPKPNIFHSSGDSGDSIYGAAVMKALGGGVLFMSIDNRYPWPMNSRWGRTGGDAEWVNNLKPLLEHQDYVERVQYTHGLPFSTTHDLNKFREAWRTRTSRDFDSIYSLNQRAFGTTWPEDDPWLEIKEPITVKDRPIVISRSPRYHNDEGFGWWNFIQKYGDKCVIVGHESEAETMQGFTPPKSKIPHYKTKDALELARVIAGSKVCVMNQSLPLAIAHGLCKNAIIEEWPANRNTHLVRPNAIYPKDGEAVQIPESWLA